MFGILRRIPPLRELRYRFRRAKVGISPTFFFHIPKCGGTSLWETIFDIYGTKHVYVASGAERHQRLLAMPLEDRRKYAAIGGHGLLGFYRELLGDMSPYHKVVILRDPIDRLVSEYNYVRRIRGDPEYRHRSELDFDEYAAKFVRPNLQVYLLTGSGDHLDKAVNLVEEFFDDWCLTSEVDGAIGRLYQLAERAPRPAKRKNRTGVGFRRDDIKSDTLKLLEEQHQNDLQLIALLERHRSARLNY